MTRHQTTVRYSPDAIIRLPCPKCRGAMMALAVIEPDKQNWEKQTFECHNCGHSQISVAKIG
jgi:hypothetical protein